jgi:hypothetical protein
LHLYRLLLRCSAVNVPICCYAVLHGQSSLIDDRATSRRLKRRSSYLTARPALILLLPSRRAVVRLSRLLQPSIPRSNPRGGRPAWCLVADHVGRGRRVEGRAAEGENVTGSIACQAIVRRAPWLGAHQSEARRAAEPPRRNRYLIFILHIITTRVRLVN